MESNHIQHHGIKGMKWYVRRFQNADGSLTAAGKKRRRFGFFKKGNGKADTSDKSKEDNSEEAIKAKKDKVLKSRSAKELYENAHLFSDAELNQAYNRLTLERNIKNLIPEKENKGKKFADESIDWTKKLGDLSTNSINLYNNVAKVYNSVSAKGRENPLPTINNGGNKKKEKDK